MMAKSVVWLCVFEDWFNFLCMTVLPVCVSNTRMTGAHRGQNGMYDTLLLGIEWLWSAMWVLGIKPRSPERTADVLNLKAFAPGSSEYWESWLRQMLECRSSRERKANIDHELLLAIGNSDCYEMIDILARQPTLPSGIYCLEIRRDGPSMLPSNIHCSELWLNSSVSPIQYFPLPWTSKWQNI